MGSYFHKKFKGTYASQTDFLNLQVFYGDGIEFQSKIHVVYDILTISS